ncbi:MAG: FAD/NAD(P)-binding protein [Candidatus Buchananbacteria bacterium]|nr:FAD/NAD(P)-binding protein [Candidatus Buchananbacteria bacterium]
MFNIYQPQKAKIISLNTESTDTKLFRLALTDKKNQKEFNFLPGQFVQIGLPGWGECPISFASSPHQSDKYFELAIRKVGQLTGQLSELKKGDLVDIRGPFGNGFDADLFKDKPLVLVGGGCGFVPLRPLIMDYLADKMENTVLQIFYGCKNEDTLLFKKEHASWNRQAELNVILEKPSSKWAGKKGLITDLFKNRVITSNSIAVLVGPPLMYRFVIAELKKRQITDENIYLSLEKKMYCGVGVCQHCAIGPYYVCKDGPVFRWSDIKDINNII